MCRLLCVAFVVLLISLLSILIFLSPLLHNFMCVWAGEETLLCKGSGICYGFGYCEISKTMKSYNEVITALESKVEKYTTAGKDVDMLIQLLKSIKSETYAPEIRENLIELKLKTDILNNEIAETLQFSTKYFVEMTHTLSSVRSKVSLLSANAIHFENFILSVPDEFNTLQFQSEMITERFTQTNVILSDYYVTLARTKQLLVNFDMLLPFQKYELENQNVLSIVDYVWMGAAGIGISFMSAPVAIPVGIISVFAGKHYYDIQYVSKQLEILKLGVIEQITPRVISEITSGQEKVEEFAIGFQKCISDCYNLRERIELQQQTLSYFQPALLKNLEYDIASMIDLHFKISGDIKAYTSQLAYSTNKYFQEKKKALLGDKLPLELA